MVCFTQVNCSNLHRAAATLVNMVNLDHVVLQYAMM